MKTQRTNSRVRVAIFEPYVLGKKLYGNARYIACLFDYLSRDKFEPILYSPIDSEFVELIGQDYGAAIVVTAPRLLRAYDGSILLRGPLSKLLTLASMLKIWH